MHWKKGVGEHYTKLSCNCLLVGWSRNADMLWILSAKIRVEAGAYFDGVWSMFKIIEYGISYFLTFDMISWWGSSSSFFCTPSGIPGLDVVAALFRKLLRQKDFLHKSIYQVRSTSDARAHFFQLEI